MGGELTKRWQRNGMRRRKKNPITYVLSTGAEICWGTESLCRTQAESHPAQGGGHLGQLYEDIHQSLVEDGLWRGYSSATSVLTEHGHKCSTGSDNQRKIQDKQI